MRCPEELHVLDAVANDRWSSGLRSHVAACASCAAAAGVAPSVEHLASLHPRPEALPDPAVLWVRSRFPEPVVRPEVGGAVNVVQIAGYLCVAAAWMLFLASQRSTLQALIAPYAPASVANAFLPAMPFFPLLLALSSMAVTLAFHKIVED